MPVVAGRLVLYRPSLLRHCIISAELVKNQIGHIGRIAKIVRKLLTNFKAHKMLRIGFTERICYSFSPKLRECLDFMNQTTNLRKIMFLYAETAKAAMVSEYTELLKLVFVLLWQRLSQFRKFFNSSKN